MKRGMFLIIGLLFLLILAGCTQEKVTFAEITFPQLSQKVGENQYDISEKANELNGKGVEIVGYMSPLTPFDANYFYMIQVPGAVCPFCDGADVDFLLVIQVYLPEGEKLKFTSRAVKVTGIFEVGEQVDQWGAKSIFRIRAKKVEEHQFR